MTFEMIRSQLEALGTPIGADDLQIAAIAHISLMPIPGVFSSCNTSDFQIIILIHFVNDRRK